MWIFNMHIPFQIVLFHDFGQALLFEYNYIVLFGLTIVYFLLLYFGLGLLFLGVARWMESRKIVHLIHPGLVSRSQIRFEMKYSLQSILIFGFSVLPIAFLVRLGWISLLPDTVWNISMGLVILFVWNEFHFFVIHRWMHTT